MRKEVRMDKLGSIGLIIGFVSTMGLFLGCNQRESQTRRELQTRPVKASRRMNLHEMALQDDTPAIARAIEKNPCLDERDGDGRTPLMLATIYDKSAIAEHLITKGANLEATDPDGRTALHLSVLNDSRVFFLLSPGGGDQTPGTMRGRHRFITPYASGGPTCSNASCSWCPQPNLIRLTGKASLCWPWR